MKHIFIYSNSSFDSIKDQIDFNSKHFYYSNIIMNESVNTMVLTKEEQNKILENVYKSLDQIADKFYDFEFEAGFSLFVHVRYAFYLNYVLLHSFQAFYQKFLESIPVNAEVEILCFDVDAKILETLNLHQTKFLYSPRKKSKTSLNTLSKVGFNLTKECFKSFLKMFGTQKIEKTVFISHQTNFSSLLENNKPIIEDKYLYKILSQFPESFTRLFDTQFNKLEHLIKTYQHKNIKLTFFDLTFRALFSFDFYNRVFTFRKKVNIFKQKNSLEINEVLNQSNIVIFISFVKFIVYSAFFRKYKIEKVVLLDEMTLITNSIVQAARHEKVKSFGIQHGVVAKENVYYVFSSKELSYFNPFPDVLFVWGNLEVDLLKENNVKNHTKLLAVGNTSIDINSAVSKKSDRKKPSISFFTQPQANETHRFQSLKDFVTVAAKYESDFEINIKLHPREYENYEVYKPLLKKLKNFNLIKECNLLTLLQETDVLCTCFSSVAIDFLPFKRPIILFDYEDNDLLKLIENNAASKVMHESDFEILLDKFKQNDLKINEEAYQKVLAHYFSNEGGTTYAKIIEEVLKA